MRGVAGGVGQGQNPRIRVERIWHKARFWDKARFSMAQGQIQHTWYRVQG
jgi:hypothetical protein